MTALSGGERILTGAQSDPAKGGNATANPSLHGLYTLQRAGTYTHSPQKVHLSDGDLDPHRRQGSLDPQEYVPHAAFRSVHPFSHSSRVSKTRTQIPRYVPHM